MDHLMQSSVKIQQDLFNALLSAYPSRSSLEQMVYFALETNLAEISLKDNLRDDVFALIRWAESKGKLVDLLVGAIENNPTNPYLRELQDLSTQAAEEPKLFDLSQLNFVDLQAKQSPVPKLPDPIYAENWQKRDAVQEILKSNFGTMDKFRDFCRSYSGVEPENLSGKNVKAKIFTLIVHEERSGRLNGLKNAAQKLAKRKKAEADGRERESQRRRDVATLQPVTLVPAGMLILPPKYLARNDLWFWFQLALFSVMDPKQFREHTSQQNVGSDRRLAYAGFVFISALLFMQILFSLVEIYPNLDNPKWAVKNEYLQYAHSVFLTAAIFLIIWVIILIMSMNSRTINPERWAGGAILLLLTPIIAFTSQIGYAFGVFGVLLLFIELVIMVIICFNIATSVKLTYSQYSIKNLSKIKASSPLILLISFVLAIGTFSATMNIVGWNDGDSINFVGIVFSFTIAFIIFAATLLSLPVAIKQSLTRNRLGTQSSIIIFGVFVWITINAVCMFYLTF